MRTRTMTGWDSIDGKMVVRYIFAAITVKPYKLKKKYR